MSEDKDNRIDRNEMKERKDGYQRDPEEMSDPAERNAVESQKGPEEQHGEEVENAAPGKERAEALREERRSEGAEQQYETNKKIGISGCLVLTVTFLALLIILGSCTGLFFGDEQDEEITEDEAPGNPEEDDVGDDSSSITPEMELEKEFGIVFHKKSHPSGGFYSIHMSILPD
ncbi:hypothetical protein [Salinicoccus sp. RF5]|uniref:hypothetical protein n=1 Tax=Salinicoccus sp. RF5 TaxID=2748874 RepID=UPI001E2DB0DF|nr:hypothetical protein [Salinicoccus sp. RF5]MCC4721995.1 hypothetical protein [Salinicoccus sp. RF5]